MTLKLDIKGDPVYEDMLKTEQMAMDALARAFVKSRSNLYFDETELVDVLQIGNEEAWAKFLNLKSVKAYCSKALLTGKDVQKRKLLGTLMDAARTGNANAAKAASEMMSEHEKQNENIIILHHIPRSDKTPPVKEDVADET